MRCGALDMLKAARYGDFVGASANAIYTEDCCLHAATTGFVYSDCAHVIWQSGVPTCLSCGTLLKAR